MSIVNVNALKQNNCILHWTGAVASANSPKQITSYGDVKQLLPFPGAGIGMFDGTGDYLTFAGDSSFIFGSGDFTIECLINLNTLASNSNIVDARVGVSATPWVLAYLSSNAIQWYDGTNNYQISTSLVVNTWYHIAVSRSGSTIKIFLDGIQIHSATNSVNLSNGNNTINIGHVLDGGADFNGKMSELRISNVARYTANFTPSRRQLESDSNTKLLLHFNRNDTTFIDSSPSAHTITAYGDAKQLCSPCGGGVAYFDGSGDYLTIAQPDTSTFVLGAYDWCIEAWCYFKTVYLPIIANRARGSTRGWVLHYSSAVKVVLAAFVGGWVEPFIDSTGITISLNTWHHIALTHTGSTWKLFINGQLANTVTNAGALDAYWVNESSCPISIGTAAYNVENYMNGYIGTVRISKGTPRYTSAFTPSTQPFKPDSYTKLLLHMDGTGNAFYDVSDRTGDTGFPILPDGVTVTPSGTFAVQKMKDGQNIWKFDGSTNYITISDHASWSMFTSDFTIAGWVKFDSIAANKVIIGQYTDANNQWYLQWTTGNIIQLYGITSSTVRFDFSCPLTAIANTWYHIVVQRSGSSCIMYINGVAQTVTQTTAFSATATDIAAVLSIGKINTEYQTGNIKDLQMFTKALTMDQIAAIMAETFIY